MNPVRCLLAVATVLAAAFRFSTNEAGVARIRIERLGKRKKPVVVGTLTRAVVKGPAKVAFTGRLGRKALRKASYRATLTVTDASGLTSKPAIVAFTVV